MRKTFITLTSAAALTLAGAVVPIRAEAHPLALWIIPTIIAAGVGGVAVGALATNANATPVVNTTVVNPETTLAPNCRFERQRIHGVWRRVEVCE